MTIKQKIEVIEVGPRDGFQNIAEWIPTETKLAIIEGIIGAGVKRIEVTSFVHPKAIPQMADSTVVMETIKQKFASMITIVALVPNLFGARKAIELGSDEISVVISASEQHNLENTRQTVAQSVEALAEICKIKGRSKIRLDVATAFACPFAGKTPVESVIQLIDAALAAGVDEIVLCDTIGTANPLQVETLLEQVMFRYPAIDFILHLHDTQGMGLANTLTALKAGCTRYETSIGGLGGCPFAPGAAGNTATEDLVNMLHEMELTTGIDLDQLIDVARMAQEALKMKLVGHMVNARRK